MKVLEKIAELIRPKKFTGRVIDVSQIFTEDKNYLHKQMLKLHHGYDKIGMPITENVMEGVFNITLENSEGSRRTFRTSICLEPQIGSYQTYRI